MSEITAIADPCGAANQARSVGGVDASAGGEDDESSVLDAA